MRGSLWACEALGWIPQAIPHLIQALQDEDRMFVCGRWVG
jgi:hypothetical protein